MENLDNIDNNTENVLNYKVKKCLKCKATTQEKDNEELFCSKCGAPVVNRCSNYACNKLLDSKAKFCKYCGSSSIFNNYGLITSTPILTIRDDLPF